MKEITYSPESKEDLLKINDEITAEYGELVAKKILTKITKTIQIKQGRFSIHFKLE